MTPTQPGLFPAPEPPAVDSDRERIAAEIRAERRRLRAMERNQRRREDRAWERDRQAEMAAYRARLGAPR